MATDWRVLAAFALYLGVMVYIGVYYYRKSHQLSDYILGNRSLGPWVTGLSAEASDMSGWMLMGLPGLAYVSGLPAIWMAIGLVLGTWANWVLVSKRLRNYTELANDSLTIPDFLNNRFRDTSHMLNLVSAIFTFIFFMVYTSSGFVAGGKLFETVFGLDYFWSLLITAGVVVAYTFLGGFMAVSWTDFIQGVMMFLAIITVPAVGMMVLGGVDATWLRMQQEIPQHFILFDPAIGTASTVIMLLSTLGWGLGYFGQPHILVRFMAINDSKELKKATNIAMGWVVISLAAAVIMGLVGRVLLDPVLQGADAERVFLVMSRQLFTPFVGGLILSAVLAAIMSTSSAQLLVTSATISKDLYKNFIHRNASEKELVFISRTTVLAVAALAIILALNPNSYILNIVAYAWAGFGSVFGPVVVMSLFWRRMTRNGALAGMLVGGITVLVWKQFAWWGLYEIVPGFLLGMLAIVLVSWLDQPPAKEITDDFDAAQNLHIL